MCSRKKPWKLPKCLSLGEWVDLTRYSIKTGYLLTIKRNRSLCIATQENLRQVTQSERSCKLREADCVSVTCPLLQQITPSPGLNVGEFGPVRGLPAPRLKLHGRAGSRRKLLSRCWKAGRQKGRSWERISSGVCL